MIVAVTLMVVFGPGYPHYVLSMFYLLFISNLKHYGR